MQTEPNLTTLESSTADTAVPPDIDSILQHLEKMLERDLDDRSRTLNNSILKKEGDIEVRWDEIIARLKIPPQRQRNTYNREPKATNNVPNRRKRGFLFRKAQTAFNENTKRFA